MNFFVQFLLSDNKQLVLKVSVLVQVIKKYIFLSGKKLNDLAQIDYVPNVFKFTRIKAKQTQESLKRYEWKQKRQRRPKVTTSEIFTAPYISNNPKMELRIHNNKVLE